MARKLRVWGTNVFRPWVKNANGSQQVRAVVATTTQKKAIELLDTTRYEFKLFACETGNEVEVMTARKEPGVVIYYDMNMRHERLMPPREE
jgi:hypothetical protein